MQCNLSFLVIPTTGGIFGRDEILQFTEDPSYRRDDKKNTLDFTKRESLNSFNDLIAVFSVPLCLINLFNSAFSTALLGQ